MTFTPTASTLVGDELLTFVKKNSSMSKTELAEATGYTSVTKEGKTRSNFAAMQEALINATGIILGGGGSNRVGPGGRKLSYVAKVQGNKNLLVGHAYTSQLGLQPGDEFTIKLTPSGIRLTPVGGAEDDE